MTTDSSVVVNEVKVRISKVRIKNFRNFKNTPTQNFFEVELGDNIILLGENGVGKTNFIDAMRLVLDPSFRPQLGENDFHNGLPRFRGTEIEIQILLTDFMGEKDEKFLSVIPDCIIQDNPPTAQISFLYCPNDDVDDVQKATNSDFYQTILYGGDGTNRSNLNKEAARRFRKYVQLKVVSALRDIERDMGVWQRSPLRKLTEVMNLVANPRFENVANQVRRATEDLQNIEPIKDLQNKIQTRLVKMIEGANSFNPQIGLLPTSSDELQKSLIFLVENDLSLDRTSLGLANILYLTLLMVEIELSIQGQGSDGYQYTILAVEEPESHLHPHLQRLVFRDFLKNSQVPILLSTHSTNIVSIAQPDWFVLLKRNLEGTRVASTAQLSILPDLLKRDLSRYLDADRGEAVFAKGIILVEGDAELFLIPAFANKMQESGYIPYTLDGAGISVCSVSGTDFIPYVYFFGPQGLNLPLVVITDGDKYVRLESRVTNLEKRKNISRGDKERLRLLMERNQYDDAHQLLEQWNLGWYEGLNRGIKIAKYLNPENAETLRKLYDSQHWESVRQGLSDIGIFVNEWTLEADLINVGYQTELLTIYAELGASKLQQKNMAELLNKHDIDKIIKRIEETGKGKGRFAQRLTEKINSNNIPDNIRQAIEFIVERVTPNRIAVAVSNQLTNTEEP